MELMLSYWSYTVNGGFEKSAAGTLAARGNIKRNDDTMECNPFSVE